MASLTTLDTRKASETPIEIEYVLSDGSGSGVFLSVLGGQSERVTSAIAEAANEQRSTAAQAAAKAALSRQTAEVAYTTFEEDVAFGVNMAALRISGWRSGPDDTAGLTDAQKKRYDGIDEPYTPAAAAELCKSNPEIAAQVVKTSNELSRFLRRSPKK